MSPSMVRKESEPETKAFSMQCVIQFTSVLDKSLISGIEIE